MTSRFSLGLLSATLAFAAAAALHASPAAPAQAAPAASMTYHIERHGQQVLDKDANEKTLTTFSAATPTLQGLFTWSAAGLTADTPRTLALTLKDQNGRRLWFTPVAVAYPQNISVNFNTTSEGTQLVINTTQPNPSNPDYPPATGLTFVVGADGRPESFRDASHRFKYVYQAHGFSVVDQDGKTVMHGNFDTASSEIGSPLGFNLHLSQDGTGTMQINGNTIVIDKITKDGKTYQSFPWNSHKVLVEQGCNWNVTSDGDLTVNAPSATQTAASK